MANGHGLARNGKKRASLNKGRTPLQTGVVQGRIWGQVVEVRASTQPWYKKKETRRSADSGTETWMYR